VAPDAEVNTPDFTFLQREDEYGSIKSEYFFVTPYLWSARLPYCIELMHVRLSLATGDAHAESLKLVRMRDIREANLG